MLETQQSTRHTLSLGQFSDLILGNSIKDFNSSIAPIQSLQWDNYQNNPCQTQESKRENQYSNHTKGRRKKACQSSQKKRVNQELPQDKPALNPLTTPPLPPGNQRPALMPWKQISTKGRSRWLNQVDRAQGETSHGPDERKQTIHSQQSRDSTTQRWSGPALLMKTAHSSSCRALQRATGACRHCKIAALALAEHRPRRKKKRKTYFLNRLPFKSLSFFVHGLMISSDGET